MANSTGKIWIGVGVAFLLFFGRGKKAMAKTELQLSPHFKLSEFLRSSSVPEVAYYHPTEGELSNLRFLVTNVLEPLRSEYGPVLITGGARPDSVRNARGQTFTEALEERGYQPAEHGDHTTFNGVDFRLPGKPTAEHVRAYLRLKQNPNVRQVILYLKTDPDTGNAFVDHIHVASVAPALPRVLAQNFAFTKINGRRATEAMV